MLRDITLGGTYYREDSIEEDNVSSLLSASYRFSEAVMGYVSWSRGYKAGGINFDVVGPFTAPTFEPERATSLELGVKTRFGMSAPCSTSPSTRPTSTTTKRSPTARQRRCSRHRCGTT
ncbi:TonB-dependent receptor [Pseudomonas sp. NA13]